LIVDNHPTLRHNHLVNKKEPQMSQEFQALIEKAYQAGRKAGVECRPVPMVVGSAKSPTSDEIDYSKPVYHCDDGACGFAWVKIRPATTPFAKWLKARGIARPAYNGGIDIWISDFGQSVDRKYEMARAMAKVLTEAGYGAYADSRLD
jgi:hypothetical protein